MGWNTSALFVRGLDPDAAVSLLGAFARTPETVSADQATSGALDEVLFASPGAWTAVWDPSMTLAPVCLPPGSGLSVIFSSVASTYAFTLVEAGAEVREWVCSEGELAVDEGAPLPVEATVDLPSWGPDEDFLWTVIESVTGRSFNPDEQFQVYRPG